MRVAVIGGGIAGLSAAWELARLGATAVVFEAAARAGGKIGSHSEQGFLTEDGPHFIARPMDALVDAAGLRAQVLSPRKPATRWVHLGGRLLAAPGLPLLLRAGAGRALLEPLFARPPGDDETLRDFLVRRLGRRAGALLAGLMAAGVYAGDAGRLSARDAFPSLAAGGSLLLRRRARPGLWSLAGGLGELPRALAARLEVRPGVQVRTLRPAWQVDGERFDGVVLAVPAPEAARLVEPFAPRFAEGAAQVRYAPVAVVHLGYAERELPRGFGALDGDDALLASGTLLPASMLAGRAPAGAALATLICGGARHPERAQLADAALLAGARSTLLQLFGVRGEPRYQRVVRWPQAIPQYEVGHRARVATLRALLSPFGRIELAGACWDGVSVPDAAASGTAAARKFGDTILNAPPPPN